MKVIVDSFLPLKHGGITVTLTTEDENISELVTMFRKEANLTLEMKEDKSALLHMCKNLLEDIKARLEKEGL